MSFEASGLVKQDPYEFWVTASTNIGEGQSTKSIVIAPSTRGILFVNLKFCCRRILQK